jgi:hypothetical protein
MGVCKNYDFKGSVEKIVGGDPHVAYRQDETIGGKPPVVK